MSRERDGRAAPRLGALCLSGDAGAHLLGGLLVSLPPCTPTEDRARLEEAPWPNSIKQMFTEPLLP